MLKLLDFKRRYGRAGWFARCTLVLLGTGVISADAIGDDAFDLKLTSSHLDEPSGAGSPDAVDRTLAGIGATARFDAPLQVALRGNVTGLFDDEKTLLATGDVAERRRLADAHAAAGLFDGLVSWTSDFRFSDFGESQRQRRETEGRLEQHRFSADVWRREKNGLSLSGAVSRVEPGYQGLDAQAADPLLKNNRATEQLGANLQLGRVKFSALDKNSTAVRPDNLNGFRASRSSAEFGASVGLTDFRPLQIAGLSLRSFMPDALWMSRAQGAAHDGDSTAAAATGMLSIGASRSWSGATVYVNRWQSSQKSPQAADDASLWNGRGLDIGSDVYGRRWSLSGALSFYSADNVAQWNRSADSSVSGSMFATRRMIRWPDLSAGVVAYHYRTDFLDYGALDLNDYLRYQVDVDFSRWLSMRLADSQLKFISSYQRNTVGSQWLQTNHWNSDAGLALRVQFALATFR